MTDPTHGRTRTLPHESTRNLTSITFANNRLLVTDEQSRAFVFTPPFIQPYARLSLRSNVLTAAISPCGKMAAFAGDKLEVWAVPSYPLPTFAAWSKIAEFASGLTSTACVAWSSDSRRISIGHSTGTVTMYTIDTGLRRPGVHVKPLVLHGHRTALVSMHFVGSNGFVTVSSDGILFCWRLRYNDDAESYAPEEYPFLKDDQTRNPRRRQFIVPVSGTLVSRHFVKQGGAKRVCSCDVTDPLLVVGLSNGIFALYELPDEMTREDKALDEGLFELNEINAKKKAREREEAERYSTRRKRRARGANAMESDQQSDEDTDESDEETPRDIGFADITLLHTLSATGGAITRISFNSTGSWIAMASTQGGQIVIWDWRAESHVLKQQAHSLSTDTAAFSPDGRAIATGSKDGRVKLWGVHTGFCVATFTNHEGPVSAVTFAANDVIVSASYDGTVRAFDIRRYRNFRIMVGPPPRRQFGCVAVDGAGELVAAGCIDTFEIIVWSLRTGQVVELLNGHQGPVSGIAFRPHRGTLASSSWDRSIRLWDMYERKGSCEVLEHSKEVLDVCFRPDGKELGGCTTGGEIVLWDPESGNVTGTIDGARDAAAGRRRESRTVAPEKGHFQSICYSADGRFIIAGAASKNLCFFHVAEGSRPSMVRKICVTENQNFDGLLDRLNTKNLTDSGHVMQEINDEDEGADDYDLSRHAKHKSLPGATSEAELQRKKLVQAEVRCVHACATGRLWSAVTAEGVLVYGNAGNDEYGEAFFDPTHLDVDVTPKEARKAADEKDFTMALMIALRLNERDCLNYVVEKVNVDRITLVVSEMPTVYFSRLVTLFAWRLDQTPHLEFNLRWAKSLLLVHGERARNGDSNVANVNSALRALNRACVAHSRRLTPIADRNEYMLSYLTKLALRKKEKDEAILSK